MTSLTNRYSEYDGLASIYDKEDTDHYEVVVAQLEDFVLQNISKEGHIFDLCCGTGQVLQRLAKKGYQVTGLDGSEAMLQYARQNVPSAKFILDDARFFQLPPTFDAVISTDVALNHVISLEDLKCVFQNVYGSLLENGLFVFDLLLEEWYTLTKWSSIFLTGNVQEEHAWIAHQSYDPEIKIIQDNRTIFHLVQGSWQRSDINLLWKAYSATDVQAALENVGFTEVNIHNLKTDLGMDVEAARAGFVCRKPLSTV